MNAKTNSNLTGCIVLVVLAVVVGTLIYGWYWWHYGPDSRHTWNPAGKTITWTLPADCKRVINASSGGNEGEMLLTYETNDGTIITHEYNQGHMFETQIVWKKADSK